MRNFLDGRGLIVAAAVAILFAAALMIMSMRAQPLGI